MTFVHLNTHSHYSMLDALGSPKDIVKKAKELECNAVGLSDNAYLYGAVEFYKAAKELEIKPIIGCDFYITSGSRFEKSLESENKTYRLTVIAKNNQGYKNLLQLSSLGALEGFYSTPRIDFELLTKYHEGLIVLSGNISGELSEYLLQSDLKKAEELIQRYKVLFKEDYYLEIQRHFKIPEYKQIEEQLIQLSEKLKVELVATHSPHYINTEDAGPHDILVCIGKQTNLNDENRFKYNGEFSFRPPTEMEEMFSDLPKAVANTKEIADKCNVEIEFHQDLIPKFITPNGESSKEYLRILCELGLKELYPKEAQKQAQKQLNYELDIVDRMGFNDYFLIVWDFIYYAKQKGIIVGPGRGSAAGAIIAYTLKITELDPIEHGLVFERFLNPDRVSMPDIDIDFADHRRHEVLEYTIGKYGKDCVSQVITYGTMSAKAAVRDIGRGMGYPYSEVDKIAKAVPQPVLGKHAPLSVSKIKDPNLSDIYKNDERGRALLDNAIKIEGTVRHAGTHACAVIIADRPLVNFTPLQGATDGSDGIVTQYSMKVLEEIGLLKMDFLGLKNLTIIEKTLGLIKQHHGKEIDITKIPMDDKKTFELLQRGDTTGVFQLESSGMRRYIKELEPTRFEDIVAMISLYRPGPLEWIPAYIEGKHKPETITYLDPSFEEILKETNGIAIYQEQILLIARHFAGFSLGQADILRRAVGKKDPKALAEQKDKFIQGAAKCGQTDKHARLIFEKVIEPFAGYGFNKAHAACYAMISYRTSYLKANYSTELMAALLTSDSDNTEKIVLEMADCEGMGIKVMPPNINESILSFSVVGKRKIRFGLAAIKGLGAGAVQVIIDERDKNGKFKSLEEIVTRLPSKLINKKTIECLAYSGALDEFGKRRTIAENYEVFSTFSKNLEKATSGNVDQTDLFGSFDEETTNELNQKVQLDEKDPLGVMERLQKEKEYLGVYVSSTPLKGLSKYLRSKGKPICDFTEKDLEKKHRIAGILTSIRTIITKSGAAMAYAELEDAASKISLVIFPKIFADLKFKIKVDEIFVVEGRLNFRRGELQMSVYEMKGISLEAMIKNAQSTGRYDPDEIVVKKQPNINVEKLSAKEESQGAPIGKTKFKHIDILDQQVIIKIPRDAPSSVLSQLKLLLVAQSGNYKVEMKIPQNNEIQTVKTSLTINNDEQILQKIEKLLG